MNDFLGIRSEQTLPGEVLKQSEDKQQIVIDESDNADIPNAVSKSSRKTVPGKQRKLDLQEYKEQFWTCRKLPTARRFLSATISGNS